MGTDKRRTAFTLYFQFQLAPLQLGTVPRALWSTLGPANCNTPCALFRRSFPAHTDTETLPTPSVVFHCHHPPPGHHDARRALARAPVRARRRLRPRRRRASAARGRSAAARDQRHDRQRHLAQRAETLAQLQAVVRREGEGVRRRRGRRFNRQGPMTPPSFSIPDATLLALANRLIEFHRASCKLIHSPPRIPFPVLPFARPPLPSLHLAQSPPLGPPPSFPVSASRARQLLPSSTPCFLVIFPPVGPSYIFTSPVLQPASLHPVASPRIPPSASTRLIHVASDGPLVHHVSSLSLRRHPLPTHPSTRRALQLQLPQYHSLK